MDNQHRMWTLGELGKAAFYLRLSMADGDMGRDGKDESNSIENQRLLLRDFVCREMEREYGGKDAVDESSLEAVSEYVDDGYSGTNFDRPGFKRLLEDAKRGMVRTIIVKDLSRLGRDYIKVGDYLEQIFPVLGVRFIAINNGYDSINYEGSTMGLEMSVTNLVNTLYSKDLSKKIRTSCQTKWKQGISTAGRVPFGYKREGGRCVVDPEASGYVRMIFEKAIGGWSTGMIVNFLNESNIPTPGRYRKEKTGLEVGVRLVEDKEWLWDIGKVHDVLKNYSYTGAMVQGKTRPLHVGSKLRRAVDRKDWFISEGAHQPIVSADEFEQAQMIFASQEPGCFRRDSGFSLKGKCRCANCGLAMDYNEGGGRVVYCGHGVSAGKASTCDRTRHSAASIESTVAYSLRMQLAALEGLGLSISGERNKKGSLAERGKHWEQELAILKAERIRQYEAYAEGVITKDEYTRKKEGINCRIAQTEESIGRYKKLHDEETELLDGISKVMKKADELNEKKGRSILTKDKPLTREMAQSFVDEVTIYGKNRMEVAFRFDDLAERARAYLDESSQNMS